MLVSRIREFDAERPDFGAVKQREEFSERKIMSVWALPVAPADVEPDRMPWDALCRAVDCLDVKFHGLQELAVGPVLEHSRAF